MKNKLHITIVVVAIVFAGLTTSTLFAAGESEAQLQAQANVTKAEAQKTALAKVPHGKVKAAELEREHGKLIWSFDIGMPHSKDITEVQVDAKTGKIVNVQVETPQDQAREAPADQKKQ
jgi:uncharacterized membrane protein YkoI